MDVSKYVVVGYIVECVDSIVYRMWIFEELVKSFIWREMKVVEIILLLFVDKISNRIVKVYIDNLNVVKIVKLGSIKKRFL